MTEYSATSPAGGLKITVHYCCTRRRIQHLIGPSL
uniref:Uncharacterized protein n=1 Tax=Anguilla anguilla TaxID=7936 RepID=A0A0E9VEK9_ANGAN